MHNRLPPPPADLNKKEAVAMFNSLNGAQIRWDDGLGEFVTTTGDRYPHGDIEEVVRHIHEGRHHVPVAIQ